MVLFVFVTKFREATKEVQLDSAVIAFIWKLSAISPS